MNLMIALIIVPFLAGLLILLVPSRIKWFREGITLLASGVSFLLAIVLFTRRPLEWRYGGSSILRLDNLSGFILLAAGLFGVVIGIYSLRFMAGKARLKEYYAYLLFTLGGTFGVLLSDHLLLLLVFWGLLGITLYLLVGIGASAAPAAKKTFVIIGGSDALMLLGLVIIWSLTGSWEMSAVNLPLRGGVPIVAFLCLAIAAFAKAGAMPFHTWIPDCAEPAPLPVVAFLPAAVDKLLGIYLLTRISMQMFQVTANSAISILLMAVGAVTVIAAVMMALIQHNLKKLLSYHAVSQVGYMVLGIGTGIPIGIAGGIFHMLNHSIYKCCLFLVGGSVEHKQGTTELGKLGGLGRIMPITFGCFMIAALSISGVPPLNGFVSKWMVYQGIIEMGGKSGFASHLWIVWLLSAMFGSALTLASFMKVLHATFLGNGAKKQGAEEGKDEVAWSMWVPMAVLALLCILFGVFAFALPIKEFLLGAVPGLGQDRCWIGWWKPGLATGLIVIGLLVGWLIYKLGDLKGMRVDVPYIGGEAPLPADERVTGTGFYETIKELLVLKTIYRKAEGGSFDIYDLGRRATFVVTGILKSFHNGVLPVYLSWCLLGLMALFFILMRR